MQRKTKLKIAFYSIGFIAFALLPYVLTEQPNEENQRFAPLPSYNPSDSSHPFLSRLRSMGSRLFPFLSDNKEELSPEQVQEIISSAAELNKATANEVLANLSPATPRASAAKNTAANAATADTPTAPAQATTEEQGGQEAAAENEFGPSPVPARNATLKNSGLFSSAVPTVVNAQGRNQAFSRNARSLPNGSKNASMLDNLIAQNDAQLVKDFSGVRTNAKGGARRAGSRSGSGSPSRSGGGSYARRSQAANAALAQAANARAQAKSGTHTYGTGINMPHPRKVQYEMMAQQEELNSIFKQIAQNDTADDNDSVNELDVLLSAAPTSNPSATMSESGAQKVKNIHNDNFSANASLPGASLSRIDTASDVLTPSSIHTEDEMQALDEDDPFLQLSDEGKKRQDITPIIFVLDNKPLPVRQAGTEGLSDGKEEPLTDREIDRQMYEAMQSAVCGQDGQNCRDTSDGTDPKDSSPKVFWVANKYDNLNDTQNLDEILAVIYGKLSGDPLNKLREDGPLYQELERRFSNEPNDPQGGAAREVLPETENSSLDFLPNTGKNDTPNWKKHIKALNFVPYTPAEVEMLKERNVIFVANPQAGKDLKGNNVLTNEQGAWTQISNQQQAVAAAADKDISIKIAKSKNDIEAAKQVEAIKQLSEQLQEQNPKK